MRQTHAPFGDAPGSGRNRSNLRFPAYAGAGEGLLTRTKTFRDRVKGEGGVIENGYLENLFDPAYKKFKEWELESDLPFFGSASAIKDNSGSIFKIFDGSGNENDATQTDTAKQPAKDALNGRVAGKGDESDDQMVAPVNYSGQSVGDASAIVVYEAPVVNKEKGILGNDDGGWDRIITHGGGFSTSENSDALITSDGNSGPVVFKDPLSTGKYIVSARWQNGTTDGSATRVNGNTTNTFTGDWSQDAALSDLTLWNLRPGGSKNSAHKIALVVIITTSLEDSKLLELENIINNYYSIF